ncbi:RnfABCDGE type electron transport complex subunit D [Sebaldella sp. S0638]|uniref:RnfABCDGE type electron transport complex subunit D n=1 Tax=Sebaldella sp. S0638 TaxID=2957809 RepID=UPI00209D57B9|nr:RnfABCDGE type electron transport complex subunit D [Sebaldella sp. S0638]MCP1224241.1 RnfABCDGE type electron transport complex subunit D [Sebaldella sp. S0638]
MDNAGKTFNPYIRVNDSVAKVMGDVILALLPCMLITFLAYGVRPLLLCAVCVFSTVLAEWLFSLFFLKRKSSVNDLSAVVTGMLLSFTLAPFTPFYAAAFGGAAAVIFGKIAAGGLGRNIFNPALLGREFMTVFFPAAMTSGMIWGNENLLKYHSIKIFDFSGVPGWAEYINRIFFTASGAIGEYSILLLAAGGIYLIYRERISWHIPFSMFTVIFLGIMIFTFLGFDIKIALGGIILGGIYMATDMPTSTTTPAAKIYYGCMIGVSVILCWMSRIEFETLSYSILILNIFKNPIDNLCRPRVFGTERKTFRRILHGFGLFVIIVLTIIAVMFFHHNNLVKYLLYVYIIWIAVRFIRSGEIS